MNAISIFIAGISIVFLTLGILAAVTYLMGRILAAAGKRGKDGEKVAAMVAKLHAEGRI